MILNLINNFASGHSVEAYHRFQSTFAHQLEELKKENQHIEKCLRKGESKTVEFKQTLSLDVKAKIKGKHIEEDMPNTSVHKKVGN